MVNTAQYCTLLTNCRVPWDHSFLSGPGVVPAFGVLECRHISGFGFRGTTGTTGTTISHNVYRNIYRERGCVYIYVPYRESAQTLVPVVPILLKPIYISTYSRDHSKKTTGPDWSQKIRNLPISVLIAVIRVVPEALSVFLTHLTTGGIPA